jgi:hypothetical protein
MLRNALLLPLFLTGTAHSTAQLNDGTGLVHSGRIVCVEASVLSVRGGMYGTMPFS